MYIHIVDVCKSTIYIYCTFDVMDVRVLGTIDVM